MKTILTSAFIAVLEESWSAVVSSTYNALFSYQNATDASLHAIASLRCKRSQLHEILVPVRSQSVFVGEIEAAEGAIECGQRACLIDQSHLRLVYELGESHSLIISLGIITGNKIL